MVIKQYSEKLQVEILLRWFVFYCLGLSLCCKASCSAPGPGSEMPLRDTKF